MIKYISRNEIDDTKWNGCISSSFNGNLYGYSWFLDSVAEDWSALADDDYKMVFPLVHRTKMGVSYIYQPFFTQQLGLYSTTMLTPEILTGFIMAIPERFKQVEINLNTHNKADESEFQIVPQLNHELDLIHPYEKIYEGYSDNLKRNLKKSGSAGLTIVKSINPDDIIILFRANRGKEIAHLKERNYMRMARLVNTCILKGIADIWGVYDISNQLLAGAFFIRSNKKAIFLFSGLSEAGRQAGAMPFLIDAYIRDHVHKHLTFDFDGSNEPNLARFYKSFGSQECIYQRVYIDRFPSWLSPGIRWAKKIKSYL